MKYLFAVLFLVISCTTFKDNSRNTMEQRWSILEKAISDKWTQEDIRHILGTPQSKKFDQEDETWFYDSKESGYQEWIISFNIKDKIVMNIGFGPTGLMDKEFTLSKILERWKKYNCVSKKSDWYSKGHTVYQDTYYLCDGNRKIEYNRYEEISWIWVRIE